MFVIKHAFLNLKSHSWNYLLAGIILFLLILGTMITSTMYTSAKLFTKNYTKQFVTLVTILEPDLSNLSHEKKLTKEQYLKFGESNYVNDLKMISSIPVSFETLKAIKSSNTLQVQKLEGSEIGESFNQVTANWFGIEAEGLVNELAESNMEINIGSANLKLNECLVSSEFAHLNQLKIGDSIQTTVTTNEQTEKQTLIVAGMYQPKKKVRPNEASQLMRIQENDVFTNWETLHAMKSFDRLGYNTVSYELKSMADFDKFLKEMKAKGLPSEYQVITNEAAMKMLLNPVNGVGSLSGTILLGFLIFGSFSLALFSIRKFRQRQTEICVLRTIGMTKRQIIKGRLLELVVVTAFSFSLALVATSWSIQSIADWQLKNQKLLMGNVDQLFSLMPNGNIETISSIPMVINNSSFINILGITSLFLMTIISIESYKIFKFEPIEFLLERNLDE